MPDLGSLLNSDPAGTLILLPTDTFKQPLPDPPLPLPLPLPPPLTLSSACHPQSLTPAPYCPSTAANDVCSASCGTGGDFSTGKNGTLKVRVTKMSRGALSRGGRKGGTGSQDLQSYFDAWTERRMASGVPEDRCRLPFLVGAPRSVECQMCSKTIHPGDGISCSVRGCKGCYHLSCAKKQSGGSSIGKKFKCPQHACFVCKRKVNLLRCVRCPLALNIECAPWPDDIIHLNDRPGSIICWRHSSDWRLEKSAVLVDNLEDIFSHLPLPYSEEEFEIDSFLKDSVNSQEEPPSFVPIKRNVYLVKKKLDSAFVGIGCACGTAKCGDDCLCSVQCISCSKACHCSEACENRPFRKEKKIRIVKTDLCGWGGEASEPISKGDFIIEYVGEVIDDALCEQRLWRMKDEDAKKFYMCEIQKDFIIDASFKGNASRFLNHSCEPNCKLEKWQVDGELRVGVFAAQPIKAGEPLTYDYRFVQFGPEVNCHCGSAKCQGFLGTKKKTFYDHLHWGCKRKRTTVRLSRYSKKVA